MARTLYRDAALADGTGPRLRLGVSLLVDDDRIEWIRPTGDEPDPGPDVEVVDASGCTVVPGLVDSHSHLTMPGGAHWIDRGFDPADRLLRVAEDNARLQRAAGVRWARDVGSPVKTDPVDGRTRGLALGVRDRWAGHREYPYVRAAGTWIARAGGLPSGLGVEVSDGDGLLRAAMGQLDDGADFVKLYLDGPDRETSPFTVGEVRAVVDAAHRRGARVTAHSGMLPGARIGAEAGVDSLEHGFQLDADVVAAMAANGVAMVSTLAVLESWRSFASTTALPRFAEPAGRSQIAARREWAHESVRLAARAGVLIAAGTDFGGGSLRANQLAWEIECLVTAGLEPWQALAAATRNGGVLLGEPEAGVIREGGPADFVLVHGDPLSDPAAMWRVWLVH
ncbi:amidohydrolase family protein [Rugosimonospora africana]|uniref:Amidohydrolase n=1 Tax=Rugosimonospora africana TaxID=556532 RepID=A0A8J3QTH9_9ACTN|nr:amidohydrolase family protein [Rugosimonospora africana]GIH15872.1 amidohydrolase [Rugosimonospora africana]